MTNFIFGSEIAKYNWSKSISVTNIPPISEVYGPQNMKKTLLLIIIYNLFSPVVVSTVNISSHSCGEDIPDTIQMIKKNYQTHLIEHTSNCSSVKTLSISHI